ncbi:MAG: Ig-like domain-containing protein [Anaeromyxobacteraceae bacterium]
MTAGTWTRTAAAALTGLLLAACSSDPEPAPKPEDKVFVDNFGPGVHYENFSGSNAVVTVDTAEKHSGTASLKITIPGATSYGGGAFPTSAKRDLTSFNALTFWAKASKAVTFDKAGFGINNKAPPDDGKYVATILNFPVTTTWTKFVVPLPVPAKLTAEDGLFYIADGGDGDYTLWIDDLQFETLSGLSAPQPSIEGGVTNTVNKLVGGTGAVSKTMVKYTLDGATIDVEAAARYFTFTSSAPAVATVDQDGKIAAVAVGTADVTAKLGTVDATGKLSLVVTVANVPTAAAPTPDKATADVISLFSNAYTNRTVDTWSATWDQADVADAQVAGNDVKKYTNLVFAGIEFTGANSVDATQMTHFHLDLWSTDATTFKVKLVDFGADNAFGGGDDKEHELTFPVTKDQWNAVDVPLANFTGLTTKAHLAQMILVSSTATVYVDNVYFYKGAAPPPPAEPTAAAPTPTRAAADVISMFSDAYTNVPVTTWRTDWSGASVVLAEVNVAGNATKKYSGLTFAGVQIPDATRIDASAMTNLHVDVWTPNATKFGVKLVNFGATTKEAIVKFDAAALPQGQWVSLDIPLSSFTGMTFEALGQLLWLDNADAGAGGDESGTFFVDNVYFWKAPTTGPAPLAVFTDDYATGVTFAGFGGADNAGLSIDNGEKHAGTASLKIAVTAAGYTGGAMVSATPKDLSAYDAVTFWAKASKAVTMGNAGLGNDAAGALWAAQRNSIPLTTTWTKFVLPIPLASKLTSVPGLFHFATGQDAGLIIWIDDVQYEALGAAALGTPVPAIATETKPLEAGATLGIAGMSVTYPANGANCTMVEVSRRYFTWATSNAAAATVDATGTVTGVAAGTADITAKLGAIDANGKTTVNVTASQAPAAAAPAPSASAANVISLFSDAYTNVPVTTWRTDWSGGSVVLTDLTIGGNATKKYSGLTYVGVQIPDASKVDASGMTHFHVDVWTPNASKFGVKLVNFGATTKEAIVAFNSSTIVQGQWVSLDIPLSSFAGMTFEAIGQILFLDNADAGGTPAGDEGGTFFVDNVYFHK